MYQCQNCHAVFEEPSGCFYSEMEFCYSDGRKWPEYYCPECGTGHQIEDVGDLYEL